MDINESFETVKNFAVDTAQAAARKAKLLAFIAKTNMTILAEQDKQKKAYTELGRLYYRDYVTGEAPDEAEYLPWCDKITDCVHSIDEARAAIVQAKAEDAAYKKNADEPDCEADCEPEAPFEDDAFDAPLPDEDKPE